MGLSLLLFHNLLTLEYGFTSSISLTQWKIKLSNKSYLLELIDDRKFMKRTFHVNVLYIFRKLLANTSLNTKLPKIIVARDFPSSSYPKEVFYLPWQNKYSNLKITCPIKLKWLWWTRLLENLLLTKYFIFVAASLIVLLICSFLMFSLMTIQVLATVRLSLCTIVWNSHFSEMYCEPFR